MTETKLTKTRLVGGRWEGVLDADPGVAEAPRLAVRHLDEPIEDITLTADPETPGRWFMTIGIPASVLTDGVRTILVSEESTGETLAAIPFIAGDALDEDLRAEIDLMREELSLLKAAFRRHCAETASD